MDTYPIEGYYEPFSEKINLSGEFSISNDFIEGRLAERDYAIGLTENKAEIRGLANFSEKKRLEFLTLSPFGRFKHHFYFNLEKTSPHLIRGRYTGYCAVISEEIPVDIEKAFNKTHLTCADEEETNFILRGKNVYHFAKINNEINHQKEKNSVFSVFLDVKSKKAHGVY